MSSRSGAVCRMSPDTARRCEARRRSSLCLADPLHLPGSLGLHSAGAPRLERPCDLAALHVAEEGRRHRELTIGGDVRLEHAAEAVGAHRDEIDAELLRRAHVLCVNVRRIGRADRLAAWIDHRDVAVETVGSAAERERQGATAPPRAAPVLADPVPGEVRDRGRVALQGNWRLRRGAASDDQRDGETAKQCAAHEHLGGMGACGDGVTWNEPRSLQREGSYDLHVYVGLRGATSTPTVAIWLGCDIAASTFVPDPPAVRELSERDVEMGSRSSLPFTARARSAGAGAASADRRAARRTLARP